VGDEIFIFASGRERSAQGRTSQAQRYLTAQRSLPTPFHRRFLSLVRHIESHFSVAAWKLDDVEIWPLARMDLYLDMYWANVGGPLPAGRSFPARAVSSALTPLTNLWKSRRDLANLVIRPKPAHAIFLGDGVSLDRIDGAWQDRYSEPLIEALERRGLNALLMQSGDLSRLPWHRPTFAANVIGVRGSLSRLWTTPSVELPEFSQVLQFLSQNGVRTPSLSARRLARRAATVAATAAAFERVLRIVRPKLAFVVTYYSGLAPAFLVACRRQCVLSIDLQHCPQEGAHKAYGWCAVPDAGYATLPAVFWNWTMREAADIKRWTDALPLPWHRSLHGGHVQLSSYLDDSDSTTKAWDAKFSSLGKPASFEREILVALQPVGGFREQWDALAAGIQSAPPGWRWWIRRHPAAAAYQDAEYARLVSLRAPNVMVEESSTLPLPALLRHMSVVVSRFSGAAAEGAILGVPSLFLSEEARGQFSDLIERGFASVVEIDGLNAAIARLPAITARPASEPLPDLDGTLLRLEGMAGEYGQLCLGVKK